MIHRAYPILATLALAILSAACADSPLSPSPVDPKPPSPPPTQPVLVDIIAYGDSMVSGGLVRALQRAIPEVTTWDHSVPGSYLLDSAQQWAQARQMFAGRDLVIWQGVNDLNVPGSQHGAVLAALGRRIDEARAAGARHVVVIPYPPVVPSPQHPHRDPIDVRLANERLPEVVASHGALLALPEIPREWVASDGLHVTPDAYPAIAAAIRATLERASH